MTDRLHPSAALYSGEKSLPVIPACEHFAGSEKLITKALELQHKLGPVFDITCDLEDGAAAGQEQSHAEMAARMVSSAANRFGQVGIRIHDPEHADWRQDVDIIIAGCGAQLAYITVPKVTSAAQLNDVSDYIASACERCGIAKSLPLHVLVETHGALRDVWEIAANDSVNVVDFGQMDFVSAHHGAIPASAMRSPGQFEHRLIVRAKAEITAAALANGVVPAHSVCLNLKDQDVVYDDACRARDDFGFLRMWSIYPAQIEPIVRAMRPDLSEAADAGEILLAAQAKDWGPIQYKQELYDRASYRYYWIILQRAHVTGVEISDHIRAAFFD